MTELDDVGVVRANLSLHKKIVRDLLYYHKGDELLSKNTVIVDIRLILLVSLGPKVITLSCLHCSKICTVPLL